MKTLEEYRNKFEKFKFPFHENECEKLAEECILHYPDNDLGYKELGKSYYRISLFKKEYAGTYKPTVEKYANEKVLVPIDSFKQKLDTNEKYGITINEIYKYSENLFKDSRLSEQIFEKFKNVLISTKPSIYFKDAWLVIARVYIEMDNVRDASKCIKKIAELNCDFSNDFRTIDSYIDVINIKEYYCLKEINVENIKNCREIYFLGENGVGKTLLLQGIINKKKDSLKDIFYDSRFQELCHQNVFAYGIGRFRTGSAEDDFFDKEGYTTLFDRNYLLINPTQWFKDVLLHETQNESQLKIETVLRFFTEIINSEENKEFRIERNGSNFTFYEQHTKTEFNHLAEGYRSVLIWLSDLLSRLTENQPYIDKLEDFYGVVLVDEIDMFLHPKWEYTIVKKLREKLPNIQWFFTTHSPMLILGASEDAVFYKLYKENGVTQISEQWKCNEINNLLSNAILTSPLFDMNSARMRSFVEKNNEIDTSNDFIESRLRNKLRARKIEIGYLERAEIDKMVDEAISELCDNQVL